MCGRGNLCQYCSRAAILTAHWESWAAGLCGACFKELRDAKKPEQVYMIQGGEYNDLPRV